MPISDTARGGMAFWGPISSAVSDRASTADVWGAIRGAVADSGGALRMPSLQVVNEMRSMAAQMRNASEALAAARATEERTGLSQGLTGAMVAQTPWGRDLAAIAAGANYLARFEAQMVGADGQVFTQWLAARYPAGTLPTTVGELIEQLGALGIGSNSLQQGDMTGIGDIRIDVI